jgi:hypothetical protein
MSVARAGRFSALVTLPTTTSVSRKPADGAGRVNDNDEANETIGHVYTGRRLASRDCGSNCGGKGGGLLSSSRSSCNFNRLCWTSATA